MILLPHHNHPSALLSHVLILPGSPTRKSLKVELYFSVEVEDQFSSYQLLSLEDSDSLARLCRLFSEVVSDQCITSVSVSGVRPVGVRDRIGLKLDPVSCAGTQQLSLQVSL